MLEARGADIFWLDAGADATEGWSFVGTGERSSLPRDVALDAAPSDPTLPPFSGGWVGWLDYESGAAAAGAPVSGPVDEAGGSWLRPTHVVAFDHTARRTWVLSADGELPTWAAEVSVVRYPVDDTLPSKVPDGARRIAEARHLSLIHI